MKPIDAIELRKKTPLYDEMATVLRQFFEIIH